MSNQRRAKTHKAAMSDGLQEMKLKLFFKHAAESLEEAGKEDSAFYFHQVVEWIMEGKALPNDNKKQVGRILGV